MSLAGLSKPNFLKLDSKLILPSVCIANLGWQICKWEAVKVRERSPKLLLGHPKQLMNWLFSLVVWQLPFKSLGSLYVTDSYSKLSKYEKKSMNVYVEGLVLVIQPAAKVHWKGSMPCEAWGLMSFSFWNWVHHFKSIVNLITLFFFVNSVCKYLVTWQLSYYPQTISKVLTFSEHCKWQTAGMHVSAFNQFLSIVNKNMIHHNLPLVM